MLASDRTGSASRGVSDALVMLLAVSTVARVALAGLLDLGQDESYALAISRTFQLSFFDHSPIAFWIAGLMQALAGRDVTPILLRLPFVLMFSVSTWALYELTRRLFTERAGLWAAGLLTTAPFFFASAGSFVVPDGPLVLFLLLASIPLATIVFDPSDNPHWRDWLLAGLALGLAMLSKYQAMLTLLGALAYLAASPRNRRWLARPQPYVAAALALLVFAPVLIWNAQNDWVSFAFQLGRGGDGHHGLDPLSLLRGVLGEALYLQPWTLVALVAAIIVAARGSSAARFCLALALPAIVLFNLLPLLGSPGLPHWSMAGWLFLFPALGQVLARARDTTKRWPLALVTLSAIVLIAVAGAFVLLASDHRIADVSPDLDRSLIEATSWNGMRDGIAQSGALDRPHTFLAAMSWLDGAHLAEALRPASPPVVLGDDPRGFAFLDGPAHHVGEDALLAVTPGELAGTGTFLATHFDSVETIGTFETAKGGFPAYSHIVLLAHNFRGGVTPSYGLR